MKRATTVEEQIKKLIERGMSLDQGEEKAKEILLDIGYFRLGFYCFPFEKTYPALNNRTHEYKDGSLLSDVVKLYYLDVDLRNILSKYIYRIEVHFRTNLVYWASNKYKDSNTWFADPSVMKKDFLSGVDKIYSDIHKTNKLIKEHHEKHKDDKYAPAWKTIEHFTFGNILKVYRNLKEDTIKLAIAKVYGIQSVRTFENYMRTIVAVRNVCAHGSIMFDLNLALSIAKGPAVEINETNKNNLYSAICVIKHILGEISKNRMNDLEEQMAEVFEKHENNNQLKAVIEQRIGYFFNS